MAAFADDGRGAVVGLTEARLPDAVHQVIHDVDRPGGVECVARRFRVVRVQRNAGDLVVPAEIGQSVGVSGGGYDVVPVLEESCDEPRTDIAGRAGDEDPRVVHRTAVPGFRRA